MPAQLNRQKRVSVIRHLPIATDHVWQYREGIMKATIRKQRKPDQAAFDEFYAHEEVSKRLFMPQNKVWREAVGWTGENPLLPEFRKSQKDGYDFAILADGRIAGHIWLGFPSWCLSSYRAGFAVERQFWGQGVCTEALKQVV